VDKFTDLEFLLLNALSAVDEIHPYGLSQAMQGESGRGFVSIAAIYKALHRLELSGLVESHWEDVDPSIEKRPRRRLYRITAQRGKQELEQEGQRRAVFWRRLVQAWGT
jgi:DNA-binding PadR family transcriptional regulator